MCAGHHTDVSPRRRLFVGIELDDAARAFVHSAATQLRWPERGARFELPEKFHLTLAFLGWTEEDRLDALHRALTVAGRASTRFGISLDRFGAFPNKRRASIVWIGSEPQSEPFNQLADTVSEQLALAGWTVDRKPQPHVTVARLKPSRRLSLPRLAEPHRLVVERLSLFQSLPAGPTTRYEVLSRFILGET